MAQMSRNGQIGQNEQEWPNWPKMSRNGQIGPKRSRNGQIGLKMSRMAKLAQNVQKLIQKMETELRDVSMSPEEHTLANARAL